MTDATYGSLRAAHQLFPSLDLATAVASSLPISSASVHVGLASGVVSLLDVPSANGLLAELRRVTTTFGRVAVTDLWSASAHTYVDGPNSFWSLEEFSQLVRQHDFEVIHFAVCDVSTGWWPSAATQVSDEIAKRHASAGEYSIWRSDHDHLDRVLESGSVVAGGLVLA